LRDNILQILQDQNIRSRQLGYVEFFTFQRFKQDTLNAVTDAAGTDGDGLGLMFDGIHRPGQIVDGFAQTREKGIEHVGGGALAVEVDLKIRDRQPAG